MRSWMVLLPVTFALLAPAQGRGDITVQASVDSNRVAVGESLTLSIEVQGAQDVPAPTLNVSGFQGHYLGPSTQISIVNGSMSASVTHRYTLIARQAGALTLGPFAVEYRGRRYQTDPITVTVTPPGQRPQLPGAGQVAAGGQDIYLTLQPHKTEMYVGERVPLDIRLLIGRARIDNPQFPQVNLDGLVMEKLGQPRQTEEIVEGRRFTVLRFATTITPLRPGEILLGPATMGMNVLVSRRGDPFADFFAQGRPFEAHAEAVKLTVRPLPAEGKPAGFSGAIGRFDFKLDVRPTELNAGDPVTIRTEIGGTGNLDGVEAPRVRVDERFRSYDPQPVKEGLQGGHRGFEQVVIPKQAGELEIAPLEFSYFDPEAGRYVTITRGPIRLTVRAAAQPQSAGVFSMEKQGEAAKAAEKLGRDIVYIKESPGRFRTRGPELHRSFWFALLQLVPPLAFAGTMVVLRRRAQLAADPRRVRFRQAGKEVRRRLAGLRAASGPAFYDGLSAALRGYLAAKLDLPPGAVETTRVVERLSCSNGLVAAGEQVRDLFDLIERVRYAPGGAAEAEREQALGLATNLVDRLEREKGLAERFLPVLAAGLCATAALGAVAASAAEDPTSEFYRGNQAYKEGSYDESIRAYRGVIANGHESGALYFNLGNAHMKKGELGAAILEYERAQRLLPGDPDVAANLAYARELAKDDAVETPLWWRLLFPLAERARSAVLAWGWTALWALFWVVLGLRFAFPARRQGAGRVAWTLGVAALLTGASFAARLIAVDLKDTAVVVSGGETPVRFEPSESGTEHFRVGEGTLLEVTDARGEWLQVRRRDGRRGWIPAAAAGLVGGRGGTPYGP